MSRGGGAFDFLILFWGRVFLHNDCPWGRVLPPSSRVQRVSPGRGGGGLVLDEIDSCINFLLKVESTPAPYRIYF